MLELISLDRMSKRVLIPINIMATNINTVGYEFENKTLIRCGIYTCIVSFKILLIIRFIIIY